VGHSHCISTTPSRCGVLVAIAIWAHGLLKAPTPVSSHNIKTTRYEGNLLGCFAGGFTLRRCI
jgi:hypothetical protein